MDGDVEELVRAIEESFGVKFAPGEIDDYTRVDAVLKVLRSRLQSQGLSHCFTSLAFWRLRRACVNVLSVRRNSIRPSTTIESIIPEASRRVQWRALSESSGLRLPCLEYSQPINMTLFIAMWLGFGTPIAVACLFFSGTTLLGSFAGAAALILGVIAMITIPAVLFRVLKPFANALPAHCRTFGEAARMAVALNYGAFVKEFGAPGDRQLISALHNLIADLIDVEPSALSDSLTYENPQLIDLVMANDGMRAQV